MAQYEALTLTKGNALGFGCYRPTPLSDAGEVELLQAVYAQGYRHFDTAELYRTFQDPVVFSEVQIGNFFRTIPRESFTVASKFWPLPPGGSWPSLNGGKFDLATVTAAVDGSLKRLGLDYLDLYYIHRMPDTPEQLDEWMHSVKELVRQGKIRHIGLSEATPNLIRRAHAIHPIAAVQNEWAVVTRNLEDTVIPVCKELDIILVAYSPLAKNLLAATEEKEAPTDFFRAAQPRFFPENFAANQAVARRIRDLGKTRGLSAGQLSLAWLYHHAEKLGVKVLPIPGTSKIAHALDNYGGLNVQLTDDEAEALAQLGAQFVGARGNDEYLAGSLEGRLEKGL